MSLRRSSPSLLSPRLAGFFVAALAGLAGCGSAPPPVAHRPRPVKALVDQPPPPAGPARMPSLVLATGAGVDDPQAFARKGDVGLVVSAPAGKLCFDAVKATDTLMRDGGACLALSGSVQTVQVEPVGEQFVVAWIERQEGSSAVRSLRVDVRGAAVGEPATLLQSADDLAWAQPVRTGASAIVLWELQGESGAELWAAPSGGGTAERLVEGASAWQVVSSGDRAAIAWVGDPEPAAGPKGSDDPLAPSGLGAIRLAFVSATGAPASPIVVSPGATAESDLALEAVGDKLLLAWTDRRELDAAVYLASVASTGAVSAPHRALAPMGEEALLGLIASPGKKHAFLAWEDVRMQSDGPRVVRFARLDESGSVGSERASLAFAGLDVPDLTADGDGVAALTLAPARLIALPPATAGSAAPALAPSPSTPTVPAEAAEAPVLPTIVRLGGDLGVRSSEPIRAATGFDVEGVPEAARALACEGALCTALVGRGTEVGVVGAPVRGTEWVSAAGRDAPLAAPLAKSLTSVWGGERVARAVATPTAGGTMLAWVTSYIEAAPPPEPLPVAKGKGKGKGAKAPPKPAKPVEGGAVVATRVRRADGTLGPVQVLSKKGVSVGGVALATQPADAGGDTVMAWVAREKGEAQVYVARLGSQGEKKDLKKVTVIQRRGKPSEASEVVLAPVGSGKDAGWVVAWIDTRDGNAEVYAARLNQRLDKVGADRRITQAAGDAAEPSLAVRGGDVLVVWSDAQGSASGVADIYAARLDAQTLERRGKELRVYTSSSHSRTPSVSATTEGYAIAWVEESTTDDPSTARVAELGPDGALMGTASTVKPSGPLSGVLALTIVCNGKITTCRAVASEQVGEGAALSGLSLASGRPSPLRSLAPLVGAVSQDLLPAFGAADASLVAIGDTALDGQGRLRLLSLGW
jgi:hypothetical protein